MGCLAVLFALNEQEVENLLAVERSERADYMHEEIEENFWNEFPEYVCELDKSWDAMHRVLTDGTLNFENEFQPLCNVIFGGEFVYGLTRQPSGEVIIIESEEDEFMILKTPEQVAEIAEELPKKTKEECRKCYDMIDPEDYDGWLDEEDFEYTWEYLQDSLDFWKKAAEEKRYVLFTVDR
ncbi:MAG: YfbM family protein [Lachnospiraceae bacterium]|nr:YfbM family protein [Lachnospiraceae bacterium]